MAIISVIVPVYKVEAYLRRCVDSILGQTFDDFELILVDDGSPDGCPAICDEYAERDRRIHVIHQENGGLSAARNAGIDWAFANSDSQWLTFIDSDDWVHPEILERLLQAAVENKVAVSVCGFVRTSGQKPGISAAEFQATLWTSKSFFVAKIENATVAWGKLYRKDCFNSLRYPVGKLHEDDFTTYKILFAFPNIAVISAPMYYYFQNASGIMGATWTPKRLDVFEAFDEQLAFFKQFGDRSVLQRRVKSDLVVAYMQLREIEKLSAQEQKKYKYASRYLKNRMKKLIFQYRHLSIIHFSTDAWLLEAAFPYLMQFYWMVRSCIRKIRHIQ